ncbi:DsbE family thiol:disulfide interchange protein [Afifella sp. H1R]|uniref:DsbE family thiol:disulfide interchange protein n=1 Tax=Afifella sp. H1R TaxID=2908841 RepID=UPI001F1E8345|nr:DsbE family thiol:disulfide interchange protein [Afifella sp. H1R]MCF1504091.1 DsbE family thiol:disulfide interchange protein [Afifella sp. H1R]
MTTAETPPTVERALRPASRRWIFGIPLLLFVGLGVAFAIGLTRNPRTLPSALIGQPVSNFALQAIPGGPPGLSSRDLVGQVSILNVFASWCRACEDERAHWVRLAAQGTVPLHGLDYKDDPKKARTWLADRGNPYRRVGSDRTGRTAIDFGVYGVPETFVIDARGRIAYKHIGPVNARALDDIILPLVRRLQQESSSGEAIAARDPS